MVTMVVAVETEKREKMCDCFLEVTPTVLAGELRERERDKRITESCSLSNGPLLLPFSETWKTR